MAEQSEYEKAEDEAATWLVLLNDDPDDAEQQAEFENWLGASDLNVELWNKTQRAYDLIGDTTPRMQHHWDSNQSPVIAGALISSQSSSLTLKPIELFSWFKGLMTFAVMTCLVIMFAPAVLLRMTADYTTSTAEQLTVTLEDGSQLYLSPESAIVIDFIKSERHVRLLKGSAFFEVSPDPDRPFRVESGSTQTTVLGTEFSVSLSPNGAVVSVLEGLVKVDDDSILPSVSENLRLGERLRITWNTGTERDIVALDEIAAWRQGELIARNMPIEDLIKVLGTYHKGAIIIRSASFKQQRVTGLYRLNDPQTTLSNLASAYGASVKQISPWLLVVTD